MVRPLSRFRVSPKNSGVGGMRVMDDLVATCIFQVMLLHRRSERDAVEAHIDRVIVGRGNSRL
jgi:hypothetical protein